MVQHRSFENQSSREGDHSNRAQRLQFGFAKNSQETQAMTLTSQTRSGWNPKGGLVSVDRREALREWLSNINEQPLDPRRYARPSIKLNASSSFQKSHTVSESRIVVENSWCSNTSHAEGQTNSTILSRFKNREIKNIYDSRKSVEDIGGNSEDTPGPNSYNVLNDTIFDRLRKRPGISMKGRNGSLDSSKVDGGPGPADYSNTSTLWRSRKDAYSMTKSKRNILDSELVAIPGPGAYEAKPIPRTTGTVKFGRASVTHAQESSPGPGAYDTLKVTDALKVIPKHRFGSSPRFRALNEGQNEYKVNVSPLSYRPQIGVIKTRVPSVKFGNESKRTLQVDQDIPGAGKYSLPNDSLDPRGVKFVRERRFLRKVGVVSYI